MKGEGLIGWTVFQSIDAPYRFFVPRIATETEYGVCWKDENSAQFEEFLDNTGKGGIVKGKDLYIHAQIK